MAQAAEARDLRRAGGSYARLLPVRHRQIRAAALHVREQFPGRQGVVLVRGVVERVQEDRHGMQRRGESRVVSRNGYPGISTSARRELTVGFYTALHLRSLRQRRNFEPRSTAAAVTDHCEWNLRSSQARRGSSSPPSASGRLAVVQAMVSGMLEPSALLGARTWRTK